MTTEPLEGIAAQPYARLARRVVPWLLLAVVGYVSLGYYNDYKVGAEKQEKSSKETTAKAAAAKPKSKTATGTAAKGATTTPAVPSQVVAVTDVNFHREPSAASDTIRTLKKDEKVTLVGQEGTWYKVTDAVGEIGYLTMNEKYTKLIKGK